MTLIQGVINQYSEPPIRRLPARVRDRLSSARDSLSGNVTCRSSATHCIGVPRRIALRYDPQALREDAGIAGPRAWHKTC